MHPLAKDMMGNLCTVRWLRHSLSLFLETFFLSLTHTLSLSLSVSLCLSLSLSLSPPPPSLSLSRFLSLWGVSHSQGAGRATMESDGREHAKAGEELRDALDAARARCHPTPCALKPSKVLKPSTAPTTLRPTPSTLARFQRLMMLLKILISSYAHGANLVSSYAHGANFGLLSS